MMKPGHIKIKTRETGTPRSSQRTRRETPFIAMTKIKMREMGTPRSSQRTRQETPARRDNKHQDAQDGNAPLVGAHEMKNSRSSQRARWENPACRDDERHARRKNPACLNEARARWKTLLVVRMKDARDGKNPARGDKDRAKRENAPLDAMAMITPYESGITRSSAPLIWFHSH
jgi:hypothetical protein